MHENLLENNMLLMNDALREALGDSEVQTRSTPTVSIISNEQLLVSGKLRKLERFHSDLIAQPTNITITSSIDDALKFVELVGTKGANVSIDNKINFIGQTLGSIQLEIEKNSGILTIELYGEYDEC